MRTSKINKIHFDYTFSDEPKLNGGAWDSPLPLSTVNKISSQLQTINSRRSEPSIHSFASLHRGGTTTVNNNDSTIIKHPANATSTANNQQTVSIANGNDTTPNRHRLEHTPSARTISSEDSWSWEKNNSEHDLSSDGEDEKSERSIASINIRNSQLRSTLNKARQHLSFEKWRNHYNNSSSNNSSGNSTMSSQAAHDATSPGESPAGRLSRWFSMRRGSTHQYDVGGKDVRDGRANSVDCDERSFASQLQQQLQPPHHLQQQQQLQQIQQPTHHSTPNSAQADVKMPQLPEVSGRRHVLVYCWCE